MNDNLVVGLPYYRMGHRSFLNDGTLGDTAVNSLPEQGGRRRSRYRLFDGSVQYEIRNRRNTVLLFVTGYESENAQRTRRSAQKMSDVFHKTPHSQKSADDEFRVSSPTLSIELPVGWTETAIPRSAANDKASTAGAR